MSLIKIAGNLSRIFHSIESDYDGKVEYVKDSNSRDVVTKLDIALHSYFADYCKTELSTALFISEEGAENTRVWRDLVEQSSVLIVDPLDGSNNLVCGIKDYGLMASKLEFGRFEESLSILPNENQILSWERNSGLFSSKPFSRLKKSSSTVYLAYSPNLSDASRSARSYIMDLLDSKSAGVYRYGSACVGLYRTLTGVHSTFLGLQMRPWDVVSYFPILAATGAHLAYSASDREVDFVVSYDFELFIELKKVLERITPKLIDFCENDSLKVTK